VVLQDNTPNPKEANAIKQLHKEITGAQVNDWQGNNRTYEI
jgi:hypothetical protein